MKTSIFQFPKARRLSVSVIAVSLLPCSLSFAAIAPGDLMITEVMANPAAVSDTLGEWFEIYNRSGTSLDLDGLVIRDSGSNQHTVSGPLVINADSYFVFGRSADTALNGGYTADYEYSNFTLGNSSDDIILEFNNIVIDSLSYNGDPSFGIAGVSAELTSSGFAATPLGLVYGDGDSGTPGFAGSDSSLDLSAPSAVPAPAAGWLMASALASLMARRRRFPGTRVHN